MLITVAGLLVILAAGLAALKWMERPATERVLKAYGNVDIREATLAFRVSGRVSEMHREEGQTVEAGQLLARLDDAPYRHRRDQAKARAAALKARLDELRHGYRPEEIEQARAAVAEAEVELRNAERTFTRQEHLRKTGANTAQQLDDARARRDRAAALLRRARADLDLLEAGYREEQVRRTEAEMRAAEASLAEARTALEDTALTAPTAGTVLTRAVEPGTIVAAGSPVYVISVEEPVYIRAYIPESDLGRIEPGMPVRVRTDSRPDTPYRGHIGFISPRAEFTPKTVQTEALRTNLVYRFRVVLDEDDTLLRQGMPVTVLIEQEDKPADGTNGE